MFPLVHKIHLQSLRTESVYKSYKFIALPPTAPSTAEATAIITFRIMSHVDFQITLITCLWKQLFCFEARTRFDPFFRLYLTVTVQVGTQIPMSAHPATGKPFTQLVNQQPERSLLFRRPGICRVSPAVQTTFIANSDTVGIIFFTYI